MAVVGEVDTMAGEKADEDTTTIGLVAGEDTGAVASSTITTTTADHRTTNRHRPTGVVAVPMVHDP
jgi:hypothetical protein